MFDFIAILEAALSVSIIQYLFGAFTFYGVILLVKRTVLND